MISDTCFSPSLPPCHASSLHPSLPHFSSVCFQCQFCCVSVSQGSFWPTHGQTHSKPVQLISILHATFPALTKLCWVYVCVHVCVSLYGLVSCSVAFDFCPPCIIYGSDVGTESVLSGVSGLVKPVKKLNVLRSKHQWVSWPLHLSLSLLLLYI